MHSVSWHSSCPCERCPDPRQCLRHLLALILRRLAVTPASAAMVVMAVRERLDVRTLGTGGARSEVMVLLDSIQAGVRFQKWLVSLLLGCRVQAELDGDGSPRGSRRGPFFIYLHCDIT